MKTSLLATIAAIGLCLAISTTVTAQTDAPETDALDFCVPVNSGGGHTDYICAWAGDYCDGAGLSVKAENSAGDQHTNWVGVCRTGTGAGFCTGTFDSDTGNDFSCFPDLEG